MQIDCTESIKLAAVVRAMTHAVPVNAGIYMHGAGAERFYHNYDSVSIFNHRVF